MLRLDLVCISFSICHHAGLRLIVWHFLLFKAFKHSNSGCVSCTAHRLHVPNFRSDDFLHPVVSQHTDKAFGCLSWRHQADLEKISQQQWALTTAGQVTATLFTERQSVKQRRWMLRGQCVTRPSVVLDGGNGCSAYCGSLPTSCGDRAHL